MSTIQSEPIPIFPLPMVAFPGEPILLHIFEPRYKEMIAECRRQMAEGGLGEFAISFMAGNEPATIATTVQVDKVIKAHADGRMDLSAKGRRRVRIDSWVEGASYRQAKVSTLPDTDPDWDEDLATRVFQAYGQLIRLVTGQEPKDADFSGKPVLSYYVIPTAGLSQAEQQHLLEMGSENDRLAFLRAHLDDLLDHAPPVLEAVRSIHTNWHIRTEFES